MDQELRYENTCPYIDSEERDIKHIIYIELEGVIKAFLEHLSLTYDGDLGDIIEPFHQSLLSDITSYGEEIRKLNEDMREAANDQLLEGVGEIDELEEDLENKNNEIKALESQIGDKDDEINRLQEELTDKIDENQRLEDEVSELNNL